MTPEIIGGIIRAVLAVAAGGLIQKGVVDDATLTAIAGGLAAVAVAGWSVIQKIKAKKNG